ncbi:MAG: hypothetical protein DLM72_15950, partial [Candidatus Nitrosopolaris wilkensis]
HPQTVNYKVNSMLLETYLAMSEFAFFRSLLSEGESETYQGSDYHNYCRLIFARRGSDERNA